MRTADATTSSFGGLFAGGALVLANAVAVREVPAATPWLCVALVAFAAAIAFRPELALLASGLVLAAHRSIGEEVRMARSKAARIRSWWTVAAAVVGGLVVAAGCVLSFALA